MNIAYAIEDIPSKGKGIICKQFVKEGDVIYKFSLETKIVQVKDEELEEYLTTIDNPVECLDHGFCLGNTFFDLRFTDTRFYNHSFNPNSKYDAALEISTATRDIHPGEEICENYWDYDIPENYNRLMKLHLNGNFRDMTESWKDEVVAEN